MKPKKYNDWFFNRFSGQEVKTKRFSGQNIKRFSGHLYDKFVGRFVDDAMFSVPFYRFDGGNRYSYETSLVVNEDYFITYVYKENQFNEIHPAPVGTTCEFCPDDAGWNASGSIDHNPNDVLDSDETSDTSFNSNKQERI